jgi:hypothetical protein
MDLAGWSSRQSANSRRRRLVDLLTSTRPAPDPSDDAPDSSTLESAISDCLSFVTCDDPDLQALSATAELLTDALTNALFPPSPDFFPVEFDDFLHLLLGTDPATALALLSALSERALLADGAIVDAILRLTDRPDFRVPAARVLLSMLRTSDTRASHFDFFCPLYLENCENFPTFPEFALSCLRADRHCSLLNLDLLLEFLDCVLSDVRLREIVLAIGAILAEFHRDRFLPFAVARNLLLLDSLETSTLSVKIGALRYLRQLADADFPICPPDLNFLCAKAAEFWRARVGEVVRLAWALALGLAARYTGALDFFVGAGCVEQAVAAFESRHTVDAKVAAAAMAFYAAVHAPGHPGATALVGIYEDLRECDGVETAEFGAMWITIADGYFSGEKLTLGRPHS